MKDMRNTILFAFALLLAGACNPSGLFSFGEDPAKKEYPLEHGMMVLGKQLEDPYSVRNITKALESLYPTKAGTVDVSETDLYVRVLPKSQEEYDYLLSLGMEMLDHPLDYEIVREGDYYHDPSIPEGDITWQYAVVRPDFEFPAGVRYEVLDHCHITEHEVFTRAGEDGIDWDAVERESFRLTGNAHLLDDAPRTKGGAAKPSGRITLVDGLKPNAVEGVKGVRVACNVFVKIGQAYTDTEGYYSIDKSFSTEPRYWLVFKNKKGYGIGLNLILVGGSSSTMGKQSQEGCSLEVDAGSDRSLFARCVVNNAVWDYFEKCKTAAGSIKAPPANLRLWLFSAFGSSSAMMLHHGAGVDHELVKKYLGDWAPVVKWFLPDVTIGYKNYDDYDSIYATVVHELAHASHFQQVEKAWWDILIEYTLTSYVESGLMTYGTGGEENAGYCEVAEMWAYYLSSKFYRERYPRSAAMFGTSYWFYPQIFSYLDDRGLDYFKIYQSLVPTVTDRDKLRDKLLALYPDFKTNILLAFNRYL